MRAFLVGGAVRDKILRRPSKDRDHVVTEITHPELISLGFIQVGKEHSVYLHPETREEYTLAESLQEDLGRRDLTMNAMAMEGDKLIDPFGGERDLKDKVLKHVKDENFYTDPLRVYRVFRFAAEFPDFEISPETLNLLKNVSSSSGFREILPERILKELEKVFSSPSPERFFFLLKENRILGVHFEELDNLSVEKWLSTLNVLKHLSLNPGRFLHAEYAALFIYADEASATELSQRLLVPNEWKLSARIAAKFFTHINIQMAAGDLLDIFYQIDAFRRPFTVMTLVQLLIGNGQNAEGEFFLRSFHCVAEISASDVSANLTGKDIGQAIKVKRLEKLKTLLN